VARLHPLIWTDPALDDLDEIAAWIALEDASAARRFIVRALKSVERLRRFPDSGRLVPEAPGRSYREVIVGPCRIVYRREGSAVLIVHVSRGERRLRPADFR
jgi:plasmid stabilization system protein ParE